MGVTVRLLGLVLVCLAMALTPFVLAEPPDQTWLGGYWDDDDVGDVVAFISNTYGLVDVSAPHAPIFEDVARLESLSLTVTPVPDVRLYRPRAPPVVTTAA
jgi:hypothetical protein